MTGQTADSSPDALYVGGYEVARMMERVGGGWFALLRYPGRESVSRPCNTYQTGRAGCEAWARRHRAALEADAERRYLSWLSRQTWRGDDCTRAREALAGLERADCWHTAGTAGHEKTGARPVPS